MFYVHYTFSKERTLDQWIVVWKKSVRVLSTAWCALHRLYNVSSTEIHWVYAPTNGNRKKIKRRRKENSKRKINSSSVRILLKANREKKAVHTDISMCLYLILCLSSERCYCRHPKSEPRKISPPSPFCFPPSASPGEWRWWWKKKDSSSINKKQNMCTVQCKRSSIIFFI